LKQLNTNFNNKLNINYNIKNNSNQIINYFDSNFNFISSNIIDLSNNEIFIKDIFTINYNVVEEEIIYNLLSESVYPYKIILSTDLIVPQVIYQLNFYNLLYDSYLFNLQTFPLELDFYLDNDLSTNVNYSIIGLTNYNINSIYLGQLYYLDNINEIDFNLVDFINYKGIQLYVYKFNFNNLFVASLITIENNNILEIYKNIGLKNQLNNYVIFYQNNFNYIANSTYINFNNYFYQLNFDLSGNYFINENIILPNIITIVILFNIVSVKNINTHIYRLLLNTPFLNFNQYINNSINIIPINFKLNNDFIPIEIIFYDQNTLISQTDRQINIINLTHYANIGETPPLEVISIKPKQLFLYQTYETFNLLTNSIIWISDTSNYLFGEIGIIDNLNDINPIQFLLTNSYSENKLLEKILYIETVWEINQYIYNPLNNNIIFEYPNSLNLNNSSNYNYYLNTYQLNNNLIYVNNNQLIINYEFTISGTFIFKQVYKSNSQIYKPKLNKVVNVKLINTIQIINNVYFIPLDNLGNNIGFYLYKIILSQKIKPLNIIDMQLVSNEIYNIKLLLWNSDNELIIGTNNNLSNGNYKLEFNSISIDVIVSLYQKSYQNGIFYYQDNINSFYLFMDENICEFNFNNQPNFSKYYMSSITTSISLNNIFNPRNIKRSSLMESQVLTNTINNRIIEKPIFNLNKLFQSISLFLGDQMIETLNEDTYNINYNFYINDEKRKQIYKVMKIKENSSGWEIYFPLIFWFYNKSNLSLPIISLPHIDFNLKYQINTLNKILSNNLTNSSFSIIPYLNIEICLDTILLDVPERLIFGSYRHEYIIERFIIYPDSLIYQKNQTVNMRYNNLVKDIFWISKPIYHPNETGYRNITYNYDNKYQYYLNVLSLYNQYNTNPIVNDNNINFLNDFQIIRNNNQEILLNNSNRIIIIQNDFLLNRFDINYILFLLDKYFFVFNNLNIQFKQLRIYFIHIYKNNKIISHYNPVTNLNLQSNGIDFLPNLDTNYYNSVIPYQKFYSSPDVGYYTTSFSLFPCDSQPSGHLNFNKFDNVVLNITSNQNVVNEPYNLVTVVKEYQILRIMSGLGSLAWLN
jgi:hypothetical protein